MLKIQTYDDIRLIPDIALREYIDHKMLELFDEYSISRLDEIGCFIILDGGESGMFFQNEMEFTETLHIGVHDYLHGVRILGDCYGEDTYLPISKGGESDV